MKNERSNTLAILNVKICTATKLDHSNAINTFDTKPVHKKL